MITLNQGQREACDKLLEFCLTPFKGLEFIALVGRSGSGKTTTMKTFLEELQAVKQGLQALNFEDPKDNRGVLSSKLILTATTNKAARVLADATGESTSTIQSALGLTLKSNFKTGKEELVPSDKNRSIHNSIVIIDEASMINDNLWGWIKSRAKNSKVIVVGDDHQLPPVDDEEDSFIKHGVAHMPAFDVPTKLVLETVMRQESGSGIATLGEEFRKSITYPHTAVPNITSDSPEVVICSGSEFEEAVIETFSKPDYHINDGRVLCWRNKIAIAYNTYIRELRTGADSIQVGDELICRNPVLFQGKVAHFTEEVVTVREVTEYTDERGVLVDLVNTGYAVARVPRNPGLVTALLKIEAQKAKKSGSWIEYFNIKESYHDLRPAFAGTTHTAQGSTYDKVFINVGDILKNPNKDDVKRMLYVAITRARHKAYLYMGD